MMNNTELILYMCNCIKEGLKEATDSHILSPYSEYERDKDYCLALLHKLPNVVDLTIDEAYYLTRFIPVNSPHYVTIKEIFVYPLVTEAEIYRRDIDEGDLESVQDIVFLVQHGKDKSKG
jgi:hypothetical protein